VADEVVHWADTGTVEQVVGQLARPMPDVLPVERQFLGAGADQAAGSDSEHEAARTISRATARRPTNRTVELVGVLKGGTSGRSESGESGLPAAHCGGVASLRVAAR